MISCNITFYNETKWVKWWYNTIRNLNLDGVDIRLNICDDGSQREPAEAFFDRHQPTQYMRLFRVKEDIGFNSHGARNLLMKQTETDWNLMSDIDRHYPVETLRALNSYTEFERGRYYSLYETIKSSPDRFSVNDYVANRKDFWKTGGYDEEFVNIHWGDREFLSTFARVAKRVKMSDWKVKYVRKARNVSWMPVATTQYPDDGTLIHPDDRWPDKEFRFALKDSVHERNRTPEGRMSKKVINFDWEQVF